VPEVKAASALNHANIVTIHDIRCAWRRYLGSSAQFWLNLQARYDLERAQDESAARIENEVRPRRAA